MPARPPSKPRPPLDAEALNRLALAYAGRFATSRAGLCRYLSRKLFERGWAGGGAPPVEALADRFVDYGYVDDKGLAEARGRSLGRRGFGIRRVKETLGALGIGEADAADALAAADASAWETALRFAERKRIGPYAVTIADAPARQRFFAAMMRAGHSAAHARKIIAAPPGVVPLRDE